MRALEAKQLADDFTGRIPAGYSTLSSLILAEAQLGRYSLTVNPAPSTIIISRLNIDGFTVTELRSGGVIITWN